MFIDSLDMYIAYFDHIFIKPLLISLFLIREVKEKVVVQVLQAHLVPGASLVSWVSLVLKEMT